MKLRFDFIYFPDDAPRYGFGYTLHQYKYTLAFLAFMNCFFIVRTECTIFGRTFYTEWLTYEP